VLEGALSQLFAQPIKITAAGRTDTGVHAAGQVISFSAHDAFPVDRLSIALNSALPADLSVRDAVRAQAGFSARHSALERSYTYAVLARRDPSAVLRRFVHHEHRELDLERMRAGAARFLGEHDFVTFCGVVPDRGGTVRTVNAFGIDCAGEIVRFHVRGESFLHRMVRIMVGTLLEVGAGRRDPEDVKAMLDARDRRSAGATAPPQGLVLAGVRYRDFSSASPHFAWPPVS
jgi:tRNA pseudouridine38-40 synthase